MLAGTQTEATDTGKDFAPEEGEAASEVTFLSRETMDLSFTGRSFTKTNVRSAFDLNKAIFFLLHVPLQPDPGRVALTLSSRR